MTRHPVLLDLTRDHQTILAHAKRLDQSLGMADPGGNRAVRDFLRYWDASCRYHVEEEERIVIRGVRHNDLQARIRSMATGLRDQVDLVRVSQFDPAFLEACVQGLTFSLRGHVRVCEWELFEDVQDTLKPQQMDQLGKLLREYRTQVRPASLGPDPSEPTMLG